MACCSKRCCDRGCSCNARKTKKFLQSDYENINTGTDFLFEFRYSQVLTVVFVTFMYSSGLPILYPCAFLTFFISYWFDKLLILKFYKSPPKHTRDLSEATGTIMQYSLLFHFAVGAFMYSNSSILSGDPRFIIENNSNLIPKNYEDIDSIVTVWFIVAFILAFFVLVIIWLLKSTIINLICCLCMCCKKITAGDGEISDNFYLEISIPQLVNEYQKTYKEKIDLEEKLRTGREYQTEHEKVLIELKKCLDKKLDDMK